MTSTTAPRLSALAAACAALASPAALRAQDAPRTTTVDVVAPVGDPAPALLHACYIPKSGTVYRIKAAGAPDKCGNNHVEFSWNEQGVQGPAGPQGPQGPAGPAGSGGFTVPFDTVAASGAALLDVRNTGNQPGSNGASFYGGAGRGVFGSSLSNAGVHGVAPFGGVGVGVRAESGTPSGTALEIAKGGIRVAGAGNNTPTAAFRMAGDCGEAVYIDNPLSNGRPDALLFVTPRTGNGLVSGDVIAAYATYDAGVGKWMLKTNVPSPTFGYCGIPEVNVLIVVP